VRTLYPAADESRWLRAAVAGFAIGPQVIADPFGSRCTGFGLYVSFLSTTQRQSHGIIRGQIATVPLQLKDGSTPIIQL
jgi:hypothetical protein